MRCSGTIPSGCSLKETANKQKHRPNLGYIGGNGDGADCGDETQEYAFHSTGTISEYVPEKTFVVKETSGPVTYKYGKKVTYVTKSGKTLSDADIKTRIRSARRSLSITPPKATPGS